MRVLGGFVGLLALAALVLAIIDGASWSGWAYTTATGVIAAACLARRLARRKWLAFGGLAIFAMTVLIRLWSGATGRQLSMSTTTASSGARVVGRILDERDIAVAGARILSTLSLLRDLEAKAVPHALATAYDEMHAAEGDAPSPFVPTYLGLQSSARADVVIVDGIAEPRGSLIFLHGFAGNFALPCWQLAQIARRRGLVTYCPSVSWRGDWWTANGASTLKATVEMARAKPIFLAGLSNGAVGAAELAARMPGTFAGLLLISGASSGEAAKIPTLVVQGRHDRMSSAAHARSYAERAGARYIDLNGGHFVFLLRHAEAAQAIGKWLAERR